MSSRVFRSACRRDVVLAGAVDDRERRGEELVVALRADVVGEAVAAVVALAEVTAVRRIATTDRRHFEPVAAALRLELVP